MAKHKGTGKVPIAKGEYDIPPGTRYRSIYQWIAGTVARWKPGHYDKMLELNTEQATLDYVGLTRQEAQELVDRWNDGDRWVKVVEMDGRQVPLSVEDDGANAAYKFRRNSYRSIELQNRWNKGYYDALTQVRQT